MVGGCSLSHHRIVKVTAWDPRPPRKASEYPKQIQPTLDQPLAYRPFSDLFGGPTSCEADADSLWRTCITALRYDTVLRPRQPSRRVSPILPALSEELMGKADDHFRIY